jgi:ABC-type branched-subunit amino acid transport system substrate-binding protein
LFTLCLKGIGQISSEIPTYKVGLFAPLYLDSAFQNNQYQFGKKFPRFTLQGFDFIQGALIASDSFPIQDCKIETFIYDSRSDSLDISTLIESHKLDDLKLIIGAVRDDVFLQMASFAKSRKIPFVSATYPNDGNQTDNPYLIILNPTLKTHCEAIFENLLDKHANDHIIFIRKSGEQEDRVHSYFIKSNQKDGKSLLKIKDVVLDSNFNKIRYQLDSTRKNIIIGGSLDEDFADSLALTLNNFRKKYDIMLLGMPNWENFSLFGKNGKSSLKELPIYYTSAYFNNRTDSLSNTISNAYMNQFKGKPSDFAFKGFESFYIFTRLLCLYPDSFENHSTQIPFNIFSSFKITPVKITKQSEEIDYYENKHLFFLKKKNGVIDNSW